MSELLLIRAKNIYRDTAARSPKGLKYPAWKDLTTESKIVWVMKADRLPAPNGPWERFVCEISEPWAVPILNWITRQFEKLTVPHGINTNESRKGTPTGLPVIDEIQRIGQPGYTGAWLSTHPRNHDHAWSITDPVLRRCVVCGIPEHQHEEN